MLGLSAEGCGPGRVLELSCAGPPADLRAVLFGTVPFGSVVFGSVGKSVRSVQILDAFRSAPLRLR